MMKWVLALGECVLELAPRHGGSHRLAFGGDVYNIALYLKRCAPAGAWW